jgi:DNA-directed RNA polymerase subunit RPC12/RpoP
MLYNKIFIMDDAVLAESFRRVNEKFFGGALEEASYAFDWKELSGQYGTVKHSRQNATVLLHSKLKGDAELSDYVMLHELLHTVQGFRSLRRHRGKFNRRLAELLGGDEFKRLERRLRAVDIKKRVFHKRFVYECPECGTQVTRKKTVRYASCARCDSEYNPKFRLKLVGIYSAIPQ